MSPTTQGLLVLTATLLLLFSGVPVAFGRGADPAIWTFATATEEEMTTLTRRFGVLVEREDDKGIDITHNLRTLDWSGTSAPPAWAKEFDQWTSEALVRRDVDTLLDYQAKGPGSQIALPTREHFIPLLVSLGAAAEDEAVKFPISGFWMGSLTRRSVQFG